MSSKKLDWSKKKSSVTPVAYRVDVEAGEILEEIGSLKEVNKETIYPDPNQPRNVFDEAELLELKQSIEQNGLLQPILVCQSEHDVMEGKYKIIAGERRWRAVMVSTKIQRIQVVVRNDLVDDLKILLAQIAENEHRVNMNIMETANAYKRVLEAVEGNSNKAIDLLGVSASRFSLVIGLNNSTEQVKELAEEKITNDAHVLASLNTLSEINESKAKEIADKIKNGDLKGGSIRKVTNDIVQEEKKNGLLAEFSDSSTGIKTLITSGITTNANLLTSLNDLKELDDEKANNYIDQLRTGELSSVEALKRVNKEITQERKRIKLGEQKITKNEESVLQNEQEFSDVDEVMKKLIIEIDSQLLEELTDFLKEHENSDHFLMVKKVVTIFENAKTKK